MCLKKKRFYGTLPPLTQACANLATKPQEIVQLPSHLLAKVRQLMGRRWSQNCFFELEWISK